LGAGNVEPLCVHLGDEQIRPADQTKAVGPGAHVAPGPTRFWRSAPAWPRAGDLSGWLGRTRRGARQWRRVRRGHGQLRSRGRRDRQPTLLARCCGQRLAPAPKSRDELRVGVRFGPLVSSRDW